MLRTKICSFKVFEAFDAVERVGNGCQSEDEDEKGKEEKEEVHEEGFPNGLSPSVAKNFFEIQGEKEEEKPARERIENASALVSKEKGVEEGKCDHLSADEDLDEEVFCQRGAGTGGRFSEDEPREESEEKMEQKQRDRFVGIEPFGCAFESVQRAFEGDVSQSDVNNRFVFDVFILFNFFPFEDGCRQVCDRGERVFSEGGEREEDAEDEKHFYRWKIGHSFSVQVVSNHFPGMKEESEDGSRHASVPHAPDFKCGGQHVLHGEAFHLCALSAERAEIAFKLRAAVEAATVWRARCVGHGSGGVRSVGGGGEIHQRCVL